MEIENDVWVALYKEIAEKIKLKLTYIQWVDLWHEQVGYLTDELPFPTPSIFISFITLDVEDESQLIQNCNTQIDIYVFYETFSDTYMGAYNQSTALEFLKTLTDVHKLLHGTSGDNYSEARRTFSGREESGGAGNLYRISFNCLVKDASAMKEVEIVTTPNVTVERCENPIPTHKIETDTYTTD